MCFVEEVILADDENENDYDGMNYNCDIVIVNVFFPIMLLTGTQNTSQHPFYRVIEYRIFWGFFCYRFS